MWSCPVAGLGSDCTRVMGGPWGDDRLTDDGQLLHTSALAAADGWLWIGQTDGRIWRCPSDLPYVEQADVPEECVLLKHVSGHVTTLLLANGRLYAGCDPGVLWSCDPHLVDDCTRLDDAGRNPVRSLAVGAGYLWAGLGGSWPNDDSGIIWRCDPHLVDHCTTWTTAGGSVESLSYDGAGTLYAAVYPTSNVENGKIWSCPVAVKNACTEVIRDVSGFSVAAGAGGVFSSNRTTDPSLYFGTTPFAAASSVWGRSASLLYIPAGGPVALAAARVTVLLSGEAVKLAKRCQRGGKLTAAVSVSGPYGMKLDREVDLCEQPEVRFAALDPGDYMVAAHLKKYRAEASFTVNDGGVTDVTLSLQSPPH